MTRFRRWCVVVVGTLLVAAGSVLLRHLPATGSDIGAADLLAQVRDSRSHGWSGYVETSGTLQLPDADRFSDVASLLGEQTRMRVWWRDGDHWRVDRLRATGETDLVHETGRTTEWDYEHAEAAYSVDPDIRLPRTADLLPPELARRFLDGADPADVTRLPSARVAGVSAPGLRVMPSSDLSSIDHVDLWADAGTGVPLRVEVWTEAPDPVFVSTFREFSDDRPGPDTVDFTPTATSQTRYDDVLDIADAANQYAPLLPPARAAGLPKSDASDGAVGVYGEGLTQAIAIPLRDREADALRDQLAVTPGVQHLRDRTVVSVGPLGVVLTGAPGEGGWLLAGSLTRSALVRAADDVRRGAVFTGDGG